VAGGQLSAVVSETIGASRSARGKRVGAFRAVVSVHRAAAQNRVRRELGWHGLAALGGFVTAALLVGLLPVAAALGVGGYAVGRLLDRIGVELVVGWLLALQLGVSVLQSSATGDWWLPWERYRSFPVGAGTLFAAELVASFGTLQTALDFAVFGGFLGGVCIARPALIPLAFVALLTSLLAAIMLRQLSAVFFSRLGTAIRGRLGALVTIALVIVLGVFQLSLRSGGDGAAKGAPIGMRAVLARLLWLRDVGEWLPTMPVGRALRTAAQGQMFEAWRWMSVFVALVVVLLLIGWWLAARETRAGEAMTPRELGTERRVPFAHSTLLTLAWLDWRNLVSGPRGLAGMLVPSLALLALRAPLMGREASGPLLVGFAYLFTAFTQAVAQLGMFGRDGRGMRTLLVLPIELRTMMRAKLLTGLLYHAISTTLVSFVLAVAIGPDLTLLLAGWLFSWCAFFTFAAIGQRTSAWLPRPITRGARSNPLALPVVLISLFTALGLAAIALVCWFAEIALGGGWLPWFALLLAGGSGLGCWAQLSDAVRFVEARRDVLLRVSE